MNIVIKTKTIAQPPVQQQRSLANNNGIFDQLDIAEGLKELLIAHSLTLELLQSTSSNDLAQILCIDEYIAKIIIHSANL